jgi:hypothetical protein
MAAIYLMVAGNMAVGAMPMVAVVAVTPIAIMTIAVMTVAMAIIAAGVPIVTIAVAIITVITVAVTPISIARIAKDNSREYAEADANVNAMSLGGRDGGDHSGSKRRRECKCNYEFAQHDAYPSSSAAPYLFRASAPQALSLSTSEKLSREELTPQEHTRVTQLAI